MSRTARIILCSVVVYTLSACGKKADEAAPAQPPAAQSEAPAPAAPVSAPAAAPEAPATDPAAAEQQHKLDFAMREDGYRNDARGQWAAEAKASTTYQDRANTKDQTFSPAQLTGAPDVEHYGDDGHAWAPRQADTGIEWIELNYAKPVNATEIRIRQTAAPGAIVKVEIFDENGASHTIVSGTDTTTYPNNEIGWLVKSFDTTPYKTNRVKITLATNMVPSWNEIDAVQLVGD
jgi:hypothetical protein